MIAFMVFVTGAAVSLAVFFLGRGFAGFTPEFDRETVDRVGLIGAFALSNNMLIIAIGLSIGALFVRSMTVHLVRAGTLTKYRFLEHGAFWAIIALGLIMLLSAKFHISESFTGLIGAVLIGLSLAWSMRYNRRHGAEVDQI